MGVESYPPTVHRNKDKRYRDIDCKNPLIKPGQMHPRSAESVEPFARPLDTICDVEPEISSCYSDLISSQFKQVGQIAG